MTQHIIIICILSILLWYYYTKCNEQAGFEFVKFAKLINENKKLKTKVKYLEKYKTDVSKTFQILDNELVNINDHIKKNSQQQSQTETQTQTSPPNPLDTIFNRFLTGEMNFLDRYRQSTNDTNDTTVNTEDIQNIQNIQNTQNIETTGSVNDVLENIENESIPNGTPLQFSVSYLPLNSGYRQFLMNNSNGINDSNESD